MVAEEPAAGLAITNQAHGATALDPQANNRMLALKDQLARVQDRYLQWRMAQQRDLQAREMALERLKADIDGRVQTAAQAHANTLAQMELQLAEYAAAIQRALTMTENPHQYGGPPNIGQNVPGTAATPQPLRLPGG